MITKKHPWIAHFLSWSQKSKTAIAEWFIRLLFAQLFLTLFSLPILLCWGLPISALTVIGNLIFNPFIGLFLLLSSLLFFCELACLPSSYIVWSLERVSSLWLWLISLGGRFALIALPRPPFLMGVLIAICACMTMWKFRYRKYQGIKVFLLLLFVSIAGLKYFYVPKNSCIQLEYGSRAVLVVQEGEKCFIFDYQGVLRPGNQSSSWVDFTLRPYLVAFLGRVTCDAIIVMQPTIVRMQAAIEIALRTKAFYIVVPEEQYKKSFYGIAANTFVHIITVPEKTLLGYVEIFQRNKPSLEKELHDLWHIFKKANKHLPESK